MSRVVLYDIEVFPNAAFMVFCIDGVYYYRDLLKLTHDDHFFKYAMCPMTTYLGYNSFHYDNIVINRVVGKGLTYSQIKELSDSIIKGNFKDENYLLLGGEKFTNVADFAAVMRLQQVFGKKRYPIGLKTVAELELGLIYDSPLSFNSLIETESHKRAAITYCYTDVKVMYEILAGKGDLLAQNLFWFMKTKGENAWLKHNAGITNNLFRNELKKPNSLRANPNENLLIPLPGVNSVLGKAILNNGLKKDIELPVPYGVLMFGVGGVHLNYTQPICFNGRILVADIKSFYPSMLVHLRSMPGGLTAFVKILGEMLDHKRSAEMSIPKKSTEFQKLVVNSAYGLLLDKNSVIFSVGTANNMIFCCFLLVAEVFSDLTDAGYPPIYVNTDGFFIPSRGVRDDVYIKQVIKSTCERLTGKDAIQWSYKTYKGGYIKDTSNYILNTQEEHWAFVAKGCFEGPSVYRLNGKWLNLLAVNNFPGEVTGEKLKAFFLGNPKERYKYFVRQANADWFGNGNESKTYIFTKSTDLVTSIRRTQKGIQRITNWVLQGAVPLGKIDFTGYADLPIDFDRYAKEVNDLVDRENLIYLDW